ncbi:ATPase-like protein, partial [Coemansia sp. RSA 2599]
MLRLCGRYVIAAHGLTVAAQCLTSKTAQLWLAKPIPLTKWSVFDIGSVFSQWNPTLHHFALCAFWWLADALLDLGSQWWTDVVWRRTMFVKSHEELLKSVSSAPLSFFKSMPTGRILSLFTNGQNNVDLRMPQRLANLATFAVKLAFESWIILMFHPLLVAMVGAVLCAMWWIVVVSRQPLAAIISVQTESQPLVDEQFQDTLAGASTIRAFNASRYAKNRLYARLFTHVSAQRAGDSIETWIDLTMTLLREAVTTMAFSIALIGAVNG